MTLTTDDLKLRGAQLAHDALDIALGLRRSNYIAPNYIAPHYLADMSTLNAELDRLLDETPEPPC